MARVASEKTIVEAALAEATSRASVAHSPSAERRNSGHRRGSSTTRVAAHASPEAVMVTAVPAISAATPSSHTRSRRIACSASASVPAQARVMRNSGRAPMFQGSHQASRARPATTRSAGCGRSTSSGTSWRLSSHHTARPAAREGSRSTSGWVESSVSGASRVWCRTKGISGTLKKRNWLPT
nr:hypothetical protein [Blastococcus sp. TML/M2B]